MDIDSRPRVRTHSALPCAAAAANGNPEVAPVHLLDALLGRARALRALLTR